MQTVDLSGTQITRLQAEVIQRDAEIAKKTAECARFANAVCSLLECPRYVQTDEVKDLADEGARKGRGKIVQSKWWYWHSFYLPLNATLILC